MWLECLREGWTAQIHEYYLRCVFAIIPKRIQKSFVGVVPDTTVQQDLMGCKQTIFDAVLRSTVNQTVTEYYEAFTSIITGSPYDETKPFPFDIGELFFGGANLNLITMINSDTVTLPVTPLDERVLAALSRLNTIEDLLIAAEGKVQVIDGQIQAMTGNHRPRMHMTMLSTVNMVAPFMPSQCIHWRRSGNRQPSGFPFSPITRNGHNPPAGQPVHSWSPSHQAMHSHPGQHRNMDLAAILHATVIYNPETRTGLGHASFISCSWPACARPMKLTSTHTKAKPPKGDGQSTRAARIHMDLRLQWPAPVL
jgi:hypothetical protein